MAVYSNLRGERPLHFNYKRTANEDMGLGFPTSVHQTFGLSPKLQLRASLESKWALGGKLAKYHGWRPKTEDRVNNLKKKKKKSKKGNRRQYIDSLPIE